MTESDPLSHIVQHPVVQKQLDAGLLTPEGKITVFSDHISMILLAAFLLLLVMPRTFRRRKAANEIDALVPSGFRNAIEAICVYFREEVARPALGKHTDRFVPYIWSVFFFVLTMNLLGIVPIAPLAELLHLPHLGGTATANIWVTGAMAATSLIMIVVNGLRFGGRHYLAHFMPGPWWLAPILLPVEILGLFAKAFALAVRLFANMVAGHTLLAVLLGFVLSAFAGGYGMLNLIALPVVLGSIAISMLEIFVAFLQAFVFTFLTAVFVGQSVLLHPDSHPEEIFV